VRWLETALVACVTLRDFADVVRWLIESGVKPPHSKSFFRTILASWRAQAARTARLRERYRFGLPASPLPCYNPAP